MDKSPAQGNAKWRLAQTPKELAFAEFQHALICLSEAFYRYAGRNLALISGDARFNGQDSVILNAINAGERPKSVTDIQHFTNRNDVANIQYSLRKLQAAGLIERAPRNEGRGTTYRLTATGLGIAEAYATARRELLDRFPQEEGQLLARLADGTELMAVLTGLYDQVSRLSMTR